MSRFALLIIATTVFAVSARGQSLARDAHKVTIRRVPETTISMPLQAKAIRLDALRAADVVRIRSNIRHLKLVLSVVEPVEVESVDNLVETRSQDFREVFSAESKIDASDASPTSLTRLAADIPGDVARREIRGRRLVITVTQ